MTLSCIIARYSFNAIRAANREMGNAVVVVGKILSPGALPSVVHGTANSFERREREYEEPPMFVRTE